MLEGSPAIVILLEGCLGQIVPRLLYLPFFLSLFLPDFSERYARI